MTVAFFAASNGSWVGSTHAFDGEILFVAGMRDVLLSLNATTGKEQWRVDFVQECKAPLRASSSSVLQISILVMNWGSG